MINELKLDLACGQNKTEGYYGIDIFPGEKIDAVVNLEEYPWSIKSNSTEDIICNHYVEHVSDLIKFMEEIYRILKPNGKIRIIAPYYTSIRCWQDPTHKRAISEASFLYFNKDFRVNNNLSHYPITCDFDYSFGFEYHPNWVNQQEETKQFAVIHYNNVVNHIYIVMTKKIKME